MGDRVILIPGLWMPAQAMRVIGRALRAEGFSVEYFSYSAVAADWELNVQRLCKQIDLGCSKKTHLVGHSLGGVLAWHAVSTGVSSGGCVVCLGSPLMGSRAARALSQYGWGRLLLGHARDVLVDPKLTTLPPSHCVGVIAGTRGIGLGRFFANFTSRHDGAVATDETQIAGLSGYLELPVAHSQMLFDSSVASATVQFLRHQQF